MISTGFAALDAELPGAGWPCHSLTEILQPQPTVAGWRLLGPAMREVVATGSHIVVVGPPKSPHLPGLKHAGLDERHLVWIQADAPAERLWVPAACRTPTSRTGSQRSTASPMSGCGGGIPRSVSMAAAAALASFRSSGVDDASVAARSACARLVAKATSCRFTRPITGRADAPVVLRSGR